MRSNRARKTDAQSSHDAAIANEAVRKSQWLEILGAIAHTTLMQSSREISEVHSIDRHTVGRRLSEMLEKGWLCRTKISNQKCSITDKKTLGWRISAKGRKKLASSLKKLKKVA